MTLSSSSTSFVCAQPGAILSRQRLSVQDSVCDRTGQGRAAAVARRRARHWQYFRRHMSRVPTLGTSFKPSGGLSMTWRMTWRVPSVKDVIKARCRSVNDVDAQEEGWAYPKQLDMGSGMPHVPADLQDCHDHARRPPALKTIALPQMQQPQDHRAAANEAAS